MHGIDRGTLRGTPLERRWTVDFASPHGAMGCTGSIIGTFTGTLLERSWTYDFGFPDGAMGMHGMDHWNVHGNAAGQMTPPLPMERWGARDRSLERSRACCWNVAGQMTSPFPMERWGCTGSIIGTFTGTSLERRWTDDFASLGRAMGCTGSNIGMFTGTSLERRWTDDLASSDGAMGCTGSTIGAFTGTPLERC